MKNDIDKRSNQLTTKSNAEKALLAEQSTMAEAGAAWQTSYTLLTDPAFVPMLYWYNAVCLERLASLSINQAQEAGEYACQIVATYPLKRGGSGVFPVFEIPYFGRRSLPFCVALSETFRLWENHTDSRYDNAGQNSILPNGKAEST